MFGFVAYSNELFAEFKHKSPAYLAFCVASNSVSDPGESWIRILNVKKKYLFQIQHIFF